MRNTTLAIAICFATALVFCAAAHAQSTSLPATTATTTAKVGAGQVGQRQTVQEAAPNIKPTGRVESRIDNRVQNRIRNRLDLYYDPTANAISPFKVASEQAAKGSSSH